MPEKHLVFVKSGTTIDKQKLMHDYREWASPDETPDETKHCAGMVCAFTTLALPDSNDSFLLAATLQ